MKLTFETQVCTRCGGTGQHSFNQRDGFICWGCGGSGKSHTKAAGKAINSLKKLKEERMSVIVTELKKGDKVFYDGKWRDITEQPHMTESCTISGGVKHYLYCVDFENGSVLMLPDNTLMKLDSKILREIFEEVGKLPGAILTESVNKK